MGEFVCRVADANGRVFSHVEAAGSLAEARQKLVERGLFVYSVDPRSTLLGALFSGALDFLNALGMGHRPDVPEVEQNFARLRKKLDDGSDRPPLIRSVRGVGYVFCAVVARRSDQGRSAAFSRPAPKGGAELHPSP